MTDLINSFIKDTTDANSDYFVWKARSLLRDLKEECHQNGIYDMDQNLEKMSNELSVRSSKDVRFVRSKLLGECEYISQLITAHQQNWEPVYPAQIFENEN